MPEGKREIRTEIEDGLYNDLERAAVATDSRTGVVREAIIYYLVQMGFHEVSNPTRFNYVEEHRHRNELARRSQR